MVVNFGRDLGCLRRTAGVKSGPATSVDMMVRGKEQAVRVGRVLRQAWGRGNGEAGEK
jgi:hypothetical protein